MSAAGQLARKNQKPFFFQIVLRAEKIHFPRQITKVNFSLFPKVLLPMKNCNFNVTQTNSKACNIKRLHVILSNKAIHLTFKVETHSHNLICYVVSSNFLHVFPFQTNFEVIHVIFFDSRLIPLQSLSISLCSSVK